MKNFLFWAFVVIVGLFVLGMWQNGADFTPDGLAPFVGV